MLCQYLVVHAFMSIISNLLPYSMRYLANAKCWHISLTQYTV